MGRTKSPVLNTRAPPKPVDGARASEAMETPSGSFSSANNSSTCPTCNSVFHEMSTTDFNNHVASCTRPSITGSAKSESTLSPPPQSPSLDTSKSTAIKKRRVEGNSRSVVEAGDGVGDSLGQAQNQAIDQPLSEQNNSTSEKVQQPTINENSNQIQDEENSNAAIMTQNPAQVNNGNGLTLPTITPYVADTFDLYLYEVKENDRKDGQGADLKDDENGSEDPKASDELKTAGEQDDLADPVTPNNEVDSTQLIEEDTYSAGTPRRKPAAGPATPRNIEDDIYGADTPRPEPATSQTVEEDIYDAESPPAETPTPFATGENAGEFSVNGAEAIKASEALSGALLGAAADVSTLVVPAKSTDDGATAPQPSELDSADIPRLSQNVINSEDQAASEAASQIAGDKEEPDIVTFKYKTFTPAVEFEGFLKGPEHMSYDELYRRTAIVADALKAYEEEFDVVNQEIYNHEQNKAFEKEIADEQKKGKEDKKKVNNKDASAVEDDALTELYEQYEAQLKFRGNKWLTFLADFEEEGGDPNDLDRLKKLHEPAFTSSLAKRKRTVQKEAAKPQKVELVNGDLPMLSKKDREPHFKRRKIIQDRVVFDEKKQSDVYQQPYNAKMTGNQKLLDRNATNLEEVELNENGRPKRSTAKRAFYDTEQSDTAPDTEPENLPAKRARRQRVVDDGIPSPGRPGTIFESRDGTPARVFPSGKRVGRPPGSKTKNPGGKATTQSKLNTVQVAEPSGSEADDGQAKNDPAEFQAQELEPAEEEQLHAAAKSLVAQTVVEANATAGGPVKKKHAGGRPKKNIAIEDPFDELSNAPADEVFIAPKPKNKGGRPRKHPAPAGGARARGGRVKKQTAVEQTAVQVGEEEEVIQSTEHDNESMFPSTNTSRPTTSSSGGTDGTFGGRHTRRTTRGKSQAQSASVNLDDQLGAPGPSVSTNGRGKRNKRTIAEDNQSAQPIESAMQSGDSEGENIVVDTYRPDLLEEFSPPKKPIRKAVRAKKGKVTTQSAPQPIAPQEVTPEQTGEASNNTTGRPKRKRAAALPPSSIDPDQLGDYLSDDDGETPPPSKRRNARGGRKGRPAKREQTTDLDTGVEGDSSVPPSRKRAVRAVTKRNAIKQEMASEESSGDSQAPQPPKTRKSRTNTLIVAEGAGPVAIADGSMEGYIGGEAAAPTPKKRPVSRGKQAARDVEIVGENIVPKKRKLPAANKGKGVALGDIIDPITIKNEGIEVQDGNENADLEFGGHDMGDAESAPPAKKRKRVVKGKATKTESTGDDDFEDSEDYTGMDPAEAELLRKKKRKSKKLAAATKARWANGTMKGPMEKRKATNAAKKAAKLAGKTGVEGAIDLADPVAVAGPSAEPAADVVMGGMGGDGAGDNIGPSTGTQWKVFQGDVGGPVMGETMAPARVSSRVRKPTSRAMGLDGADDYSDEEGSFKESEYDRFQQLSSPKGGFNLIKRARKSYIGLDDEDSF
ncbi:hypothetical protein L207DRAFT_568127 [Hyaloscypha variabilis F]|uniref:Uncharacterized protein n=1 Tax=Hyaloscypha variabilis (strain UAMH 11265 / GT02V1 / F) TaxID=1149755 RepID=A0A2J6RJ03_HYAVF|nr:hypothetical protein L207DRAFT_568127 [Hyaloscypha variabilis F]